MRGAPAGAVVVVEFGRSIGRGIRRLLSGVRLLAADRSVSVVAVTEGRWSPPLRDSDCVVSSLELWDPATLYVRSALSGLSRSLLGEVVGRWPAVITDLLAATEVWTADEIGAGLDACGWLHSPLDELTAHLLGLCSPSQREALTMCARLGYWHPQLGTDVVRASELRPWVLPLERDWGWLRPIWARSLRHVLARSARSSMGLRPSKGQALRELPTPRYIRRQARPGALVEAHLFGTFELHIDGAAVALTGQRGVSVLRYLLARRRHSCSRDELIEEFWPDAPPLLARNRLQVALSGLRQHIRDHTPVNVIEYVNGGYRINPELQVHVDAEQFEAMIATGRAAQRSGDVEAALAAYREAVELYRGDFASDAPFEQWTLLPRESLRLAYLDALDRTCRILLDLGRLEDCIAAAHRMLDMDPCREDAHRLLMRCYVSQGRPYQALRQYEMCRRVLRASLSARPAPETTRIYELIRSGARTEDVLAG